MIVSGAGRRYERRYGWLGAAWSSLATDGSLAIVNWTILQCLGGDTLNTSTIEAEHSR